MAGELLTSTDTESKGTIADRYRLVRLVGSGGMGSVFEAEDLRFGRRCAVKILREELAIRPTARRRFEREASLLGRLVHENIVQLWDVGVADDGRAYLVLEFLQGRTLRAELQQSGVRSVPRLMDVVGQVARGLGYAHASGVVHRDLKPDNVMLTAHADGRLLVKLLDFGIARPRDGSGEPVTLTDTGIGTAAYMAPEQARGEHALEATTDVYALGVVVYEALTGQRPYEGSSYNETLFQILNRSHKPLAEVRPDLGSSLCAAVERALAKSPSARFASVRAFAAELGVDLGTVEPTPNHVRMDGPTTTTATFASQDRGSGLGSTTQGGLFSRSVLSGLGGAALGALAIVAFQRSPPAEAPPSVFPAVTHSAAPAPVAASALEGRVMPEPGSAAPPETARPVAQTAAAPQAQAVPPFVHSTRGTAPRVPSAAKDAPSQAPAVAVPSAERPAEPAPTPAKASPQGSAPIGYIADSPYASPPEKSTP